MLTGLLNLVITGLSAQPETDTLYAKKHMNYEENLQWLKAVKPLNKEQQWEAVAKRYFLAELNIRSDSGNYCLPLLIINGIPFLPSDQPGLSDRYLMLLNSQTIQEIIIVDTISNIILCRPFNGVVLLSVDRKTSKALQKLQQGDKKTSSQK